MFRVNRIGCLGRSGLSVQWCPDSAVNGGRSLYEVQQILGHSDPKVTMRYAHLSTKALQEAANVASVIVKAA